MLVKQLKIVIRENKFLHTCLWEPEAEPKAIILMLHGLGNYGCSFENWAAFFSSKNYIVLAPDLRGHGQSLPIFSQSWHFKNFIADTEKLVSYCKKKYNNLPIILYGHCLGANIALYYATKHKNNITAIIAASPRFEILKKNKRLYYRFLKFLTFCCPFITLTVPLQRNKQTRDEAIQQKILKDTLILSDIHPGLILSIQESSARIIHNKHRINLPVLVMQGEKDKVNNLSYTFRFMENSGPNMEFKLWKNAYHELHNEINREEIFRFVNQWLNRLNHKQ